MKGKTLKVSLLLIFMFLFLWPFSACEYQETLENARLTIDGQDYEIKRIEPKKPADEAISVNGEKGTILPPSTKYAVVTLEEVYLTNTVLYLYPDVTTIVNYSIKENGVWVFYKKTLELNKKKDGPFTVEQQKM